MPDPKQVVHRIFDEVINQGRMDSIDELFTEVYVDHGPMGDMHGRGTFRQLVEMWRAAVPDVHCTVDNVVADGDLVGWMFPMLVQLGIIPTPALANA